MASDSTTASERRLRAELNAELGFYPASLDAVSIAKHRALASGCSLQPEHHLDQKWAHYRLTRAWKEREAEHRKKLTDIEPVESSPPR